MSVTYKNIRQKLSGEVITSHTHLLGWVEGGCAIRLRTVVILQAYLFNVSCVLSIDENTIYNYYNIHW